MLTHRLDAKLLKTKEAYLNKLKMMGIKTLRDLLLYFPRAHRNEQEFRKINELRTDEVNVLEVTIRSFLTLPTRSGKTVTRAVVFDSTGELPVMWFNQGHLKEMYFKGSKVILTGKVKFERARLQMMSPKIEKAAGEHIHTGRIVPVYPESEPITSQWLRTKIHHFLPYAKFFDELLPEALLLRQKLMGMVEAVEQIHFPKDEALLTRAKARLAFEELFVIQFLAQRRKWRWQRGFVRGQNGLHPQEGLTWDLKPREDFNSLTSPGMGDFLKALPFELTGAQKRTLEEIFSDLRRDFPMLRLVQGDVGAGKTAVAAAVIFAMIRSGFQTALMAPTEILARQHFKSLTSLFARFGMNVQLLVGSLSASERDAVLVQLATGTCDLVIGTHAVIQDGVQFSRLGLAVIDEQHRFGVKQRALLKARGSPHMLNLSATPIPRTLALTIYGDQDLSILDELPPGRTPIVTRLVPESKRIDAYLWTADQIAKGRQVFIVCPLIEESEALQVRAATLEYERLQRDVFPSQRLALLHGRMPAEEKDQVMKAFSDGVIDVLVSTSVIEVGIDVPNATIMMIEGADRFGLSQLHQFRGRVGRGAHQSYCFLFTDSNSEEALQRLKYMTQYASGFDLAEMDLKLRGPGEIYGVKQSGVPDLKMASFGDHELLNRARAEAQLLLEEDLELNNTPLLKDYVNTVEAGFELGEMA